MPRKTLDMTTPVQQDYLQQQEDKLKVTSREMASKVDAMNHFAGGESKNDFTAVEAALVIFGTVDTKRIYALYDSGSIGGSDFGTGTKKRDLHISRDSLYDFLQVRCSDRSAPFTRR